MKTVKLIASPDDDTTHSFSLEIDGQPVNFEHGDSFHDEPYESTDAWAIYTVLKKLAAAGLITLECDPKVDAWYQKQPQPFQGYPGPPGMTGKDGKDGKCGCADMMYALEGRVTAIEKEISNLPTNL